MALLTRPGKETEKKRGLWGLVEKHKLEENSNQCGLKRLEKRDTPMGENGAAGKRVQRNLSKEGLVIHGVLSGRPRFLWCSQETEGFDTGTGKPTGKVDASSREKK